MRSKCIVKNGKFVEPCDRLHSASEQGNPSGNKKGIFAWAYNNQEGPTRTMFGVKGGEHIKNGLLFNFCPFCGERIDTPFNDNNENQE